MTINFVNIVAQYAEMTLIQLKTRLNMLFSLTLPAKTIQEVMLHKQ